MEQAISIVFCEGALEMREGGSGWCKGLVSESIVGDEDAIPMVVVLCGILDYFVYMLFGFFFVSFLGNSVQNSISHSRMVSVETVGNATCDSQKYLQKAHSNSKMGFPISSTFGKQWAYFFANSSWI